MAKKDEGLNSKNVPFTQSGAGLALMGVNERNVWAKYDTLRGVRDQKEGGSRQLWKNLERWTSTPQGKNLNPQQASLFNQFIQTGKRPDGLTDQTVLAAMDWGGREAGRFQQHKPISLLEKIAGPVLTLAASAIPVIGPYAGAAVGGYVGSRNGGGPLSILSGMAGGYLGGQSIANAGGVSNIANNVRNSVGNLFNSGGFSNPSALGLSGSNLGLNFASAPGGFAAAPVAGYGTSALGFTPQSLGVGLTNSLGGEVMRGYGNSAIGGALDTPGLINAPTAGSTPRSVMGPPRPGSSPVDSAIRAGRTGIKIANALTEQPPAGGGLMTPGAIGSPSPPMAPRALPMRPFIPYKYFGPNSNPFMARIV
jgi:hypothetical protein